MHTQAPFILRIEPPPPKKSPQEVHAAAVARGARCVECPLYGCDRGPVLGTIRPGAPLIAVGEAPGASEVQAQQGFVGASGQILNASLAEGGLAREQVSVTNTILCQPPGDESFSDYISTLRARHTKATKRWQRAWLGRPGDASLSPAKRESTALRRYEEARAKAEMAAEAAPEPPPRLVLPQDACRPRLERDLAESASVVTLAVGKQALIATSDIFGLQANERTDKPKVASIKKQHGAPVLLPDGRVLIASYHPAFAMRDKCEYMPVIRENIARAARIAKRNGAIDWTEPHYLLGPPKALILRTLHRYLEAKAEVTVDIETDDKDPHLCRVRCVGLGARLYGEEVVIVVPFRRMNGTPWWSVDDRDEIGLLLRRVLDECPLVMQNGPFDTTVLLRVGLLTRREKTWTDSMVLHHDTPDNDLPHDLGFITRRYFEVPLWKTDVDHKSVDVANDYYLHLYCARDVLATMRAIVPLRALVAHYGTEPQYATDRKMLIPIRDMSEMGVPCNEWLRGRLSRQLNQQCRELIREFQELAGSPVNPRSAPQIRELLYVDWDYVPIIATDGYEWEAEVDEIEDGSTSNAALTQLLSQQILDETHPHYRALEKLLEFRAVDKLRSVNVDNLKTYAVEWDDWFTGVHAVGWVDPVIEMVYDADHDRHVECEILPRRRGLSLARTTYKGHVVSTGRLASGDPTNFQNITKRGRGGLNLRDLFVAPPGHVIVGADYEQIEARLYAVIAQDRVLLNAIFGYDSVRGCVGHDIHSLNAASLFCKPGEDLIERYRWVLNKPKEEKDYIRTVAKRFCIAEGEPVLAKRDGDVLEVPIERVDVRDMVWDGEEWVHHEGVIDQGEREVIYHDGLWATEDHEVWLEDGRKVQLGEAAAGGYALARTACDRDPVRFVAGARGDSDASSRMAPHRRMVRTYDLFRAGPRRRFTVSGRLASNCFGLIYGAGWKKVYQVMAADRNKATGERLFPRLREIDCQEWEANWHRLHPETRMWHARCHAAFNEYGFTGVPMLDFRKRFFPGGVAQPNAIPNLTIQTCVPARTRVLTDLGYQPIGELRGRAFRAWTGRAWAPAVVLDRGPAALVRLHLSDGKIIECDDRHQVKAPGVDSYTWRKVTELAVGDVVALTWAQPLEYGQPLDPEDAYWMGYHTGNGWVGEQEWAFVVGRRDHLDFEPHVERLRRWLDAPAPTYGQKDALGVFRPTSAAAATHARVYGRKAGAAQARRLGLRPGTAHTKRVPEAIWRADLAARTAFLRGVYDADFGAGGCLNTCNARLAEDLYLLGQTVGLPGRLSGPYRADADGHLAWRLYWRPSAVARVLLGSNPGHVKAVHAPLAPAFEAQRLLLRSRREVVLSAPNAASADTLYRRIEAGGSVSLPQLEVLGVKPEYDLARVTRIEYGPAEEMYTLSVDHPDHAYVAEGLISRNSAASITNKATLKLADAIPHRGWSYWSGLVFQVHDYLGVIVPEARAEEAARHVEESMYHEFEGMKFDAKAEVSWAWGAQ